MRKCVENAPVMAEQTIGEWTFRQVTDCSLISLATRAADQTCVQETLGHSLPGIGEALGDSTSGAFWMAPHQWMLWSPYGQSPVAQADLSDAAYLTDQTDGWIRFDITGADFAPVLERLCDINLSQWQVGCVQRTQIHHIGVFVLYLTHGLSIWVPRSMAASLWHAAEQATRTQQAL